MDKYNLKKLKKSKSFSNNLQKQEYKRPFSLEKIAEGIGCGYMIDSIRYRYIDPKTKKRKEFVFYNKLKKKQLQDKLNKEIYSSRKIKFHKYEAMKDLMVDAFSPREKRSNSTQFVLPPITLNKKKENKLIITSGMIGAKKFNNYKINKIKISSLLNIDTNNKYLKYINYKRLNNNNSNRSHFNLKENKKKKISKYIKKLTKFGLITKLFHKYSSVEGNKAKLNEKENNSNNSSFEIGNSMFLTNLKGSNSIKKIDIRKIMNRDKNLIYTIRRNNNKIINENKNIFKNYLQSELHRDKILYKKNGKSISKLENDDDYLRIKKFEENVDKMVKKDDKDH